MENSDVAARVGWIARRPGSEFRAKYRAFVGAFRAGAERLKRRAGEFADMFPLWSFPPGLPCNAPA
jgi:hypothetical protein